MDEGASWEPDPSLCQWPMESCFSCLFPSERKPFFVVSVRIQKHVWIAYCLLNLSCESIRGRLLPSSTNAPWHEGEVTEHGEPELRQQPLKTLVLFPDIPEVL